jgi:hypothetical protein
MILQSLKKKGVPLDDITNFEFISDKQTLWKKNELQTIEIEQLKTLVK